MHQDCSLVLNICMLTSIQTGVSILTAASILTDNGLIPTVLRTVVSIMTVPLAVLFWFVIELLLGTRYMFVKAILIYVTRFGKTCLYARIIFFLIYLLKLSVTAYLSYGASFDATLSMVLTI